MTEIYNNNIENKIFYLSLFGFILLGLPFTIFGGLIPIISKDLGVSAHFIGLILSLSAFSNFIAVLIAGNLIELFGIRRVLILGTIFEIMGMLMINFARNNATFTISYLISGLGTGSLGVSFNSLVSATFESQRSKRLLFLGIANFIGVILGALFIKILLSIEKNWRYGFLTTGFLFIILLIGITRVDLSKFKVRANYNIKTFLKMYKRVLLNVDLLIIGVIVFLFNGNASIFINWFTTYFKGFDIPVDVSSLFIVFYSISMIVGMFLKVFLLRFLREINIIMISSFVVLTCFVGLIFFDNLIIKTLLIAGIGMNAAGIFMLAASIGLGVSKENSGIVLGYIYSCAYGGSIVLLYISGLVVDKFPKSGVVYMCTTGWAMLILFALLSLIIGKRKQNESISFKYKINLKGGEGNDKNY